MKLISINEHVKSIIDYVEESKNERRGIELIKWYSDLINQPLSFDMFDGANPLFPNFKITDSHRESTERNIKNSIHRFGDNEFSMTLYRKSDRSKTGYAYMTYFHLKNVIDLCDKDVEFNIESDYAASDLFD